MPRRQHLGFRYLKTIRADAAHRFRRLQFAIGKRAIISKLRNDEYRKLQEWSIGSLKAHYNASNDKPLKFDIGVSPDVVREIDSPTRPLSANHGQIVAVKDNFVTTNLPTTCASHILQDFKPSEASTVCEILEQHGMKIVAKTNMDEFGMGSHSTYSAYGAVHHGKNPHKQSVGGSSGGSAVAVADGLVHAAIGSDTGGSVRLPAAYTGIVGFKPSYGRISRYGLVPYANSLDTVGIMGKDVLDVWLMYRILNLPDAKDPTCLSLESRTRIEDARNRRFWSTTTEKPEEREATPIRPIVHSRPHSSSVRDQRQVAQKHQLIQKRPDYKRRRRVGVPTEYNINELHPLIRRAWVRTLSLMSDQGHDIVPISLPNTKQALSAYYVLAPAEASSNLAKYDGVRYGIPRDAQNPDDVGGTLYAEHRGKYFGDEVKRRILLGTFSLSAGAMDNYFIQAQKVRRLVQEDFNLIFRMDHPLMEGNTGVSDGVDVIICPTAPTLPPLLSDLAKKSPLDSYINDIFTVPASLAGLPAVSVPVIYDESVPMMPDRNMGMQIIGQYGDDMAVLNFARTQVEPGMNATTQKQRTSHLRQRLWDRPRIR